jgi:hypothetical protein
MVRMFRCFGPVGMVFHIGPVSELLQRSLPRKATLMLTLTDAQGVVLRIQAVDKKGNPAGSGGLDGVPKWTESDATVLTLTPSDDGMTCQVASTGKIGTSQVTCSATLKGSATEITGTLDVNVVPGDAIAINIAADTPTEV